MKIHEYQAKAILKEYGVRTLQSVVVDDPASAAKAYDDLQELGDGLCVGREVGSARTGLHLTVGGVHP